MKNYSIIINLCGNRDIQLDIKLENEEMVKEFIAKLLEEKCFFNSDMNICIATDKLNTFIGIKYNNKRMELWK